MESTIDFFKLDMTAEDVIDFIKDFDPNEL